MLRRFRGHENFLTSLKLAAHYNQHRQEETRFESGHPKMIWPLR
ncbi:hypothetical protein OHAE_131 [Ochrobactrum soli]|uniref:Uncharacterized protein n=1 Tax=Ochrobactrum soli TaxID=2448455 RepID=A0A2P9HJD2_9HYPH|nr:hypothetical protein OHAE_131 [[Ochrobactrum] soli]